MSTGFMCLYFFARTKCRVSRGEGIVLLGFYVLFVVAQVMALAHFAGE
jgi:Ca2+/Na+ antiporter